MRIEHRPIGSDAKTPTAEYFPKEVCVADAIFMSDMSGKQSGVVSAAGQPHTCLEK